MGISDDIHRRSPVNKRKEDETPPTSEVQEPAAPKEDISDIIEPLPETDEPVEDSRGESFFGPKKKSKIASNHSHKSGTKKSLILAVLLILLVLTLVSVAVYQNIDLIKRRILKLPDTSSSTSTITDTNSETGTDTAEDTTASADVPVADTEITQPVVSAPVLPEKSSFTIRISNGNGVKGSADTVRDTLKAADFNVVSVGNANTFNYKTTVVYYKAGKEVEAGMVKDALTTRTVSAELSSTLTSYDVLVVVGTL